MSPTWKLDFSTPMALDNNGFEIKMDKMKRVNPVSRIEVTKLNIICFFL